MNAQGHLIALNVIVSGTFRTLRRTGLGRRIGGWITPTGSARHGMLGRKRTATISVALRLLKIIGAEQERAET